MKSKPAVRSKSTRRTRSRKGGSKAARLPLETGNGHAAPAPDATRDALLFRLHTALDLESFWRAINRLIQHALPHHSCSLLFGIVDAQPREAKHHVVADRHPDYQPPLSLSIAADYLTRHPRIKLYTFSQIVGEDPGAQQRRREQENGLPGDWTDFVHLAFWDGPRPDAVLSVRRDGKFTPEELAFLAWLHPVADAALHRLRAVERVKTRHLGLAQFLTQLPVAVIFLDFDLRLTYASSEGYEACAAWALGGKARAVNARAVFKLPAEIARACEELGAACGHDDGLVAIPGKRIPHPTEPGLVARVVLSQPVHGAWAKAGFVVTFSMERNLDGAKLAEPRASLEHLQALSPSERRVALLVAEGHRTSVIAQQLGKSVRTIESQLHAIFRKLDVSSRMHLMRLLA